MNQMSLFNGQATIPARTREENVKRNWENAFQKWANQKAEDGTEHYGNCGFSPICD